MSETEPVPTSPLQEMLVQLRAENPEVYEALEQYRVDVRAYREVMAAIRDANPPITRCAASTGEAQ